MDRVFSFLLWPKCEARGPWKQGRKKRGSITCCTDRANEANKMFIIWLCRLFRFWKGDRELAVRTVTYGPGIDQSQHAKSVSHIITYHIISYLIIWLANFSSSDWSIPGPITYGTDPDGSVTFPFFRFFASFVRCLKWLITSVLTKEALGLR